MQRSTDPAAIEPYLRDASNYAEGIVFHESEKEVVEFMRECAANKTAVTVSGNGGGMAGARVPLGGWVLATDKLGGLRDLHRDRDGNGAAVAFMRPQYPDIPVGAHAAIYIEQECQAETQEFLLEQWYILFENHSAFHEAPWFAEEEEAFERLHAFRHGVADQVRQWLLEHGRCKIGTDYAVPAHQFAALMRLHREGLEANELRGVTFGHIGDCHVHLNILPRTDEESRLARVLYEIFVDKVLAMGGTISAEHGVGKLKRDAFRQMVGDQVLAEMAAAKLILDSKGLLGRGNLFPG